MGTIADNVIATLKANGVTRAYGVPGDSLNGFTEAMRRDGGIAWRLVRHEESAAFAAAADAAPFDVRRQVGELSALVESAAGASYLAQGYCGWPAEPSGH